MQTCSKCLPFRSYQAAIFCLPVVCAWSNATCVAFTDSSLLFGHVTLIRSPGVSTATLRCFPSCALFCMSSHPTMLDSTTLPYPNLSLSSAEPVTIHPTPSPGTAPLSRNPHLRASLQPCLHPPLHAVLNQSLLHGSKSVFETVQGFMQSKILALLLAAALPVSCPKPHAMLNEVCAEYTSLMPKRWGLLQAEKRSGSPWVALLSREYRAQLVLAIAMPFFQMATGINAVVFFSPQLFGGIGSFGEGAKGGLIASAVIGTVQVDFMLPSSTLTAARLRNICRSCCAPEACCSCTHM